MSDISRRAWDRLEGQMTLQPVGLRDVFMAMIVDIKLNHVGQEAAVKAAILGQKYGLQKKELGGFALFVGDERREHHCPICSGRSGYFWPSSIWEAEGTRDHLRRRASSIFRALHGFEQGLQHDFWPGFPFTDEDDLL